MTPDSPVSSTRLQGRRAVITGGGGGVGRATAIRLASEGASVAILDMRGSEAELSAKYVAEAGGVAVGIECDVTSEESVIFAMRDAAEHLGGIDTVHVNAATLNIGELHTLSLADWNRVIAVNLTGAFLTIREAVPHLIANGGGAIVTTGSIESLGIHTRSPASASYPASKGGVLQLTRAVAVEYASHRIRANCVCPGAIRTSMMANIAQDFPGTPEREQWKAPMAFECPDDRPCDPEDIAAAVAFLVSPDAEHITGIALPVDGGWSAI